MGYQRHATATVLLTHARRLAAAPTDSPPSSRSSPSRRERGAAWRRWCGGLLLLCGALSWPALSRAAPPFGDSTLGTLLQRHCAECHDDATAEGQLSLTSLATGPEQLDRWTRVYDQIRLGRMPPADAPTPSAEERQRLVDRLARHLTALSLERQRATGRVVLRRLNRTEYETTLRDLLHPRITVRDLLPSDNIASGFDNVSAVLDVSSVHLLRYQEAAERALQAVIPRRRPEPFHSRLTGRQVFEKQKQAASLPGRSVRLTGDVLEQYVKPWSHVSFGTATVPSDGRYRVRAAVAALHTGDRPWPIRFTVGWDWGRAETQTIDVRDAPAGEPRVIELEVDLRARELVDVTGWTLPTERQLREGTDRERPLDELPGIALHWVEISGPLEPWPPPGYVRLFGELPFKQSYRGAAFEVDSSDPRGDARRLLATFLPQAFRRPVPDELLDYYVGLAHAALDRRESFENAMLLAYRAALCSPHFLYLTEPISGSARDADAGRLDDYAVAARLSYFLWSTTPDQELLDLAAQGKLSQPALLREQVERLLADRRAQRFTEHFAGQWLDLRQINATTPDPAVYGEFDDFLAWSMPRETTRFFAEILEKDLPIREFVGADWSFLNERLAQHYGIPGVTGGELRRVALPPESHRGGLLTQAAILKVTADGTKTSPVLRGKWVLERILGQPPAPPPANVAAIEPDIRGTTTIREQLDKHRTDTACAACHQSIDPPGFALESFDVIGGWRDFYRGTIVRRELWTPLANYPGRQVVRGPDVDASGKTPAGQAFRNIDDYKQLLLADSDQLVRNLAEKLVVYSTGGEIQFADREVIEQFVIRSRQPQYGFRSLLHDVVQSRLFLSK
ncbi:MAG: DUF1592 domain-containing protein [Pirellulales bacterium]